MTTADNTITIPKWVVIAGAFLVAIAVAMLIGFTIAQSQPSDADLLARAMAGDREAGETLEAKYAEPVPVPISPKEANFTPGVYTEANPNATDGADVIASFIFFLLRDRSEALNLVENPDDGEAISQMAKQNAFENATVHNEQGELIFSENQGVTTYILVDKIVYQIVYDQEPDRYRILLATDKLEEAKKQAEEDFLSLVGLNPKDACSLNLEMLALRTSGAMAPSYCLDGGIQRIPRLLEEDGSKTALGRSIVNLKYGVLVSELHKHGQGTVLSGDKIGVGEHYYATVTTRFSGEDVALVSITMNEDGEWEITGAN